jgi:serine/threonine-protein kinase SRPK3
VLEVLGPSLRDIQDRYHTEQREVPSLIVKRATKQVLVGLDYLHRSCRIVHTGTPPFENSSHRLDLQPNNILLELQEPDSVVTAFLESQVGGKDAETLVLPTGEEYNVAECCSLPVQVSPLQDWNVRVKIADLGMGKRHPRSPSNLD